jgi:ankyrin repeat protein
VRSIDPAGRYGVRVRRFAWDRLAAAHVCSLFGLTNLLQRLPTGELDRLAPDTGRTPLVYACEMGHVDTATFLLDFGANPNPNSAGELTVCPGPVSALNAASTRGHERIVRVLLDAGADPNIQDCAAAYFGVTPLMSASRMGHTDIVKLLLEHGADVNAEVTAVENLGRTSLAYACMMGHVDIVKLLLEHGANPNLKSAGGLTALHEAIDSKHLSVIELLLGMSIVKLTPMPLGGDGTISLLVSLLGLQSLKILQMALDRDGLDINEKNHNGRTAIWWLLRPTHYAKHDLEFQVGAMRLIVQHPDCEINAVDLGGQTYIMRLLDVRITDTKLLSLLLENGADVNYMDEDGETAIFHAVTTRYSLEITSLLIRHGADIAQKNRWGQGLCHRLVADVENLQDLQYLDLLLKHMPALIDAQDDRGRTPLHLALVFGKVEIAKQLLARAADPHLLDKFGRFPFDVAYQYGRTTMFPGLVPVGIYKLDTNTKAQRSEIASQTRQPVPVRVHPLPPRAIRRAQSELDLHTDFEQTSMQVHDPWDMSRHPTSMDEAPNPSTPNRPLPRPKDRYSGYPEPSSRILSYERPEHGVEWLPDAPANQPSQPTELVSPITSGREADIQRYGHAISIAAATYGQVLLEGNLDNLPGWSLGYLGEFVCYS